MLIITVLSVMLNALVLYRVFKFFHLVGQARESDKTIVATLGALSAMFIAAQVVTWGGAPWMLEYGNLGSILMMAFNFSNSFFYLAHITSLTERTAWYLQRG